MSSQPLSHQLQILWFHLPVGEEVLLERRPVLEGEGSTLVLLPSTQGAGDDVHLPLHYPVDVQAPGLTEPLAAVPAVEGPLLAVRVLVVTEVVSTSEGFMADVTREGPFISVCTFMDHEVVGLGDLSGTELADEPLLGSGGGFGGGELVEEGAVDEVGVQGAREGRGVRRRRR